MVERSALAARAERAAAGVRYAVSDGEGKLGRSSIYPKYLGGLRTLTLNPRVASPYRRSRGHWFDPNELSQDARLRGNSDSFFQVADTLATDNEVQQFGPSAAAT